MKRVLLSLSRALSFTGVIMLVFSIMATPVQKAYGDDGIAVPIIIKVKDNTCSNGCTGYTAGSCSSQLAKCNKTSPKCDDFYCDDDAAGCSCWK